MGAVFLGTPAAAIPSLAALADIDDVDLVITKPDRSGPRSGRPVPPPVKTAAIQFGFAVAQPTSRDELLDVLSDSDYSVGVVVAYGSILTEEMLATTRHGFVNIHFSLLPRWRGAAPVERAILAGDARTGVTLMNIDKGLDTGDVIAEVTTPIGPDETGGSLTARLSFLGAMLIDDALPDYLAGRRTPVPQIESGASHAPRLNKAESRLAPTLTATSAEQAVRAFSPRPIAWLATPGGRLRVHRAAPTDLSANAGSIVAFGDIIVAGFEDGAIQLLVVQPEGKSRLEGSAWFRGVRDDDVTFS